MSYYEDLQELFEVRGVDKANEMLKKGFRLVKPTEVDRPDAKDRIVRETVYIFGSFKGKGPAKPATSGEPPKDEEIAEEPIEKVLQKSIDSLEWKDGKYGRWAFARTQGGNTTPGAEDLIAAIQSSKDGKLYLGGEMFKMSADGKFLNRSKVKK